MVSPHHVPVSGGLLLTAHLLCLLQAQQSMEQGGRDVYDKRTAQPANATGGIQLGPASAALKAVERAAALAGPRMIRCELCQVCSCALHCSDTTEMSTTLPGH